jgi:hypothetical protein
VSVTTGEAQGGKADARFAAVVDALADESGVTVPGAIPGSEKFGSSPELRVDDHIFAMLVRGRLVVKRRRHR